MFATGLVVREGGWILTNYHVAKGAVPDTVTCSMGSDDPPWGGRMRFFRLAPNGSEILMQTAKSFVSSRDSNNLGGRVIMIDNWNHCCPR